MIMSNCTNLSKYTYFQTLVGHVYLQSPNANVIPCCSDQDQILSSPVPSEYSEADVSLVNQLSA